jgi:hypothetical protein
MISMLLCAVFAVQQDPEQTKQKILEKTRQMLDAERPALLERIGKILDEELKGKAPASSLEDKWREKDKKLVDEVKKEKPEDEDLQSMFQEAMAAMGSKEFDECIPLFKKIFYAKPESGQAQVAAYNCACAYSLDGKKAEANDWLRLCVQRGFLKGPACGCHDSRLAHLEADSDFDNIRDTPEWAQLLKEIKPSK